LKRRISVTVLLLFVLSMLTTAQTGREGGGVRQKKVSFSGKISEDCTAIVVGGRTWLVSNVEKLKSHASENVTVKGLLDPVTNRIEVLSMKLRSAEGNTSARLGDSAFRR
jgi:hypothetical protein